MTNELRSEELQPTLENRRNVYRFIREGRDEWEVNVNKNYLVTKNIVDINGTGLSFRAATGLPLELGETVHLQISLAPEDVFTFSGKIAWVRPLSGTGSGMSHFGVRFEKVPAWIDARIVSRLQKRLLDEGPKTLNRDPRKNHGLLQKVNWAPLEAILACSLFVGLVAAVWAYSSRHPEKSLEVIFNQGLAKKLSASQK
jgi:hypothetical protein